MNAAGGTTNQARRRPLRIVLADDNPDIVISLKMILELEGHEVQGVTNPLEVLELVREFHPDVVILDLAMPGRSGFSVAQDIREHYSRKPLLIAITGEYKAPADKMFSLSVGFQHHLLKPCDPNSLLAILGSPDTP